MQSSFKEMEYRFSVESTTTENLTLLYKTDNSKANINTSRMGCTRRSYHKERSFATSITTSYISFCVTTTQISILILSAALQGVLKFKFT